MGDVTLAFVLLVISLYSLTPKKECKDYGIFKQYEKLNQW